MKELLRGDGVIELCVGVNLADFDSYSIVARRLLMPELGELSAVLMRRPGNAVEPIDTLDVADQLVGSIGTICVLKIGEDGSSVESQQRLRIQCDRQVKQRSPRRSGSVESAAKIFGSVNGEPDIE